VNAGPNQTINNSNTAQLSGSVQADPNGGAVTVAWSEVGGPGTVTFAGGQSGSDDGHVQRDGDLSAKADGGRHPDDRRKRRDDRENRADRAASGGERRPGYNHDVDNSDVAGIGG
jgi:hypothetical protein